MGSNEVDFRRILGFFFVLLSGILCIPKDLHAQEETLDSLNTSVVQGAESNLSDEARIPGYKDPKKAMFYALLFPGGGQIYNEKVWKVPLIYGGILTSIYFFEFNNRRYQSFVRALEIIRDPSSQEQNPFPNLNQDGIIRNVNYWRRNRDSMFLVFGGIYALGFVDAFVDAHLSGFDISDDLTLKVEPSMQPIMASQSAVGLSLKFKF
ncbi:DUF5683 domain-containing protein [Lunatimonas salinarum]|uniref:DUF5683 domain-containing protein n=1 Tax=Lunatimonas salinarum TaxID=1774590 RepID=UPI001FD72ABB|nr:DUF5683 domain-containing protein [Lunatimonas salinarum]